MNDALAVIGILIAIGLLAIASEVLRRRKRLAAAAPLPAAPDIRTIGPRSFRKLDPRTVSFGRDRWLSARLLEAGIGQVKRQDRESDEDLCWRLTRQAFDSPALPELLGGQLMPAELEEAAWTPEIALEIAHWLAARTDPGERQQIYQLVTETMTPFFLSALASKKSSPSSSGPAASSPESRGLTAVPFGTANGA